MRKHTNIYKQTRILLILETFYVKMKLNLVLYIDRIKVAVNSILTFVSLLRLKLKEKKNRHDMEVSNIFSFV